MTSGSSGGTATNDDLAGMLKELSTKVEELKPRLQSEPTSWWGMFWQAAGSGLFFIFLGLAILYYASEHLGVAHVTYSFVLVVLGIALILYGTGTQGMATLNLDPVAAAKINAGLVGGAGAIAMIVGFGLAYFNKDIRQTFSVDRKHIIIPVAPKSSETDLSAYLFEFARGGERLPAYYDIVTHRVLVVLAFDEEELPWTQSKTTKNFSVSFEGYFLKKPDLLSCISCAILRDKFSDFSTNEISISESDFNVQAGGVRYPMISANMVPKVDLVNEEKKKNLASPDGKKRDEQRKEIFDLNVPATDKKQQPANIPPVELPRN